MSGYGVSETENMEARADTGFEGMQSPVTNRKKGLRYRILLFFNILMLAMGSTPGPLLTRIYFLHGGSKRWFSSWLGTVAWPLLLPPLYFSYRRHPNRENGITPKLFLASCGIGILTGADNYLYVYGLSFLPASTATVLLSTQLGFNAIFALLLVRQKFSPFSVNSVVLLTAGSVLLAFHTSGDMPEGVTRRQYVLGFIFTLGAAALYGLIIPLIELTYKTTKSPMTYTLVMEMQVIMSISATVFCTVGMLVNGEFQALPSEAERFRLGKVNYCMDVLWAAVMGQFYFLGVCGVTFMASSLLSGVIIAVTIPGTEVLAVLLFNEKFSAEKGMSLVLALWGLASYLYGEYLCYLKLGSPKLPEQQNKSECAQGAVHVHAHQSITDL